MGRMRKSELQRIFGDFNRTHCAGEGEGGVGGGSSGDSAGSAGEAGGDPGEGGAGEGDDAGEAASSAAKNDNSAGKDEPVYDPKTYLGSKKVNPEQRPLKHFDRAGMSKAKIDAFIAELGSEAFMTDEEIKAADEKIKKDAEAKGAKDEKDKKSGAKNAPKGKDGKGEKKDEASDSSDSDIDEFFEKTGLNEEVFNGLPEETQKKLVSAFEEIRTSGKAYKEIEEKYTKLEADGKLLLSDPVHAARNEEIRTGRAYIAKDMPQVPDDIVSKVSELVVADDVAGAKKLVNEWAAKNVKAMVAHERSVLDRQMQHEKLMSGAHEKFLEIAKMSDNRIKITEKDHYKLNEGHEEYKDFNDLFSFFKKKGYTLDQIANKHTAKELFDLFAISKGWDKEREKNIAKNATKSLYERLKNPRQASTLDPRQRSTTAESGAVQAAASEKQMIDEVAHGNYKNLDAAIEAAEGRPSLIKRLERIRSAGEALRREQKK
jgi:hypothetical protein